MLEQIKGLDVVTIGLVVVPRGLTQIVLMLVMGPFVTRYDPRVLMAIGFTSYATSSWMMANYNMDIGLWEIIVPSMLQGVTSAFVWLPVLRRCDIRPPTLRTTQP